MLPHFFGCIYHFVSKQLRSWPEAALVFLHGRCLQCPLLQSCLAIQSKYITTSRKATQCVWYKVIKSGPSGIFDIVLCPDNSYHLLSYIFGVFLCSVLISMSNVSNLFQNGHFTILKVRKKAKIRNRCNQVPHLTQDTINKSDKNARTHHIQER